MHTFSVFDATLFIHSHTLSHTHTHTLSFSLTLQGVKWGANVWVWNGPRKGYTQRNPRTGMMELNEGGLAHSTWGWFRKQAPDIAKYISVVDNPSRDQSLDDFPEDQQTGKSKPEDYGFPPNSIATTFMSTDSKHSKLALYWEDEFFADVYFNEAMTINSYASHTWHLKAAGESDEVLATWTVRAHTEDELRSPHIQPQQIFTYEPEWNPPSSSSSSQQRVKNTNVNVIPDEIDDADYDEL